MTDTLEEATSRLRTLGRLAPSKQRWAEVEAGLANKWEGVQSVALDVLGHWGGRESVGRLRSFLEVAFEREFGWAIRGVAVRNLVPLVSAEDADWVLELYFTVKGGLHKHELLRLVLALPPASARHRLIAELKSADATNRQAAVKAIGNMAYRDRRHLVAPLQNDSDERVRQTAILLASR